jgi:hypothetical protein
VLRNPMNMLRRLVECCTGCCWCTCFECLPSPWPVFEFLLENFDWLVALALLSAVQACAALSGPHTHDQTAAVAWVLCLVPLLLRTLLQFLTDRLAHAKLCIEASASTDMAIIASDDSDTEDGCSFKLEPRQISAPGQYESFQRSPRNDRLAGTPQTANTQQRDSATLLDPVLQPQPSYGARLLDFYSNATTTMLILALVAAGQASVAVAPTLWYAVTMSVLGVGLNVVLLYSSPRLGSASEAQASHTSNAAMWAASKKVLPLALAFSMGFAWSRWLVSHAGGQHGSLFLNAIGMSLLATVLTALDLWFLSTSSVQL